MTAEEKEKRIAAEKQRLNVLFADLDENQLQAAAGLISSAAFLAVSLEDLEAEINANGCIDEYVNGRDQYGYKVAASVQAYTALNAKYQSTMQKLLKIVPPAPKKKSAKEIAAEKAKKEAEEKAARELEKSERCSDAFMDAIRAGTTSYEKYTEFCAAWDQEHADD